MNTRPQFQMPAATPAPVVAPAAVNPIVEMMRRGGGRSFRAGGHDNGSPPGFGGGGIPQRAAAPMAAAPAARAPGILSLDPTALAYMNFINGRV